MTIGQKDRSSHKISWSRNGFIAFSDLTDSTNLSITKLEAIKGSSWHLAPKKTYTVKPPSQTHLRMIQSVHWSPAGPELAVIDELGSVTIIGTGLTRVGSQHQLSCYEDIDVLYQDDVGKCEGESLLKCIAFKWLNVDKPIIATSPTMAQNDKFNYSVHQYKSYGCLNPIQGKTGCVLVRRNGLVNLYYQNAGNVLEFSKTDVMLEENIWFDQASIGYLRDGTIIVTAHSVLDRALRVYKLSIDWGATVQTKLQPSIKVEKLICERLNRVGKNGLILELDRVEIISPNFSLDTELDILLSFIGPGVIGKTLLQKYQISTEFKNLRFKSDMGSVEGYPNLVLIGEDTLNDEILDIGFKNFDFSIVIITTEGQVQLRSRKKLALRHHSSSSSSITTLLDTGFKFVKPDVSPEAMCIAPSISGYVCYSKHELTFHPVVKVHKEWQSKEIGLVSSGVATLFASAGFANISADELIAVVQNEVNSIVDKPLRQEFILRILKECHLSLNFTLDYSKDQIDKLLVSPPLQRLLALQYSLGKLQPTNEQSNIADCSLNLRLVAFSIMLSLRTLFHQQQRIAKKGNYESLVDAIYRSESLLSTIGPINWFIDLLVFSIQELMNLSVDKKYKTIILSLFLSKIPRALMIYSIAGIKRINGFLTKMEEQYRLNRQHQLNNELLVKSIERFRVLTKLVNLDQFEKFFMSVEGLVVENNGNKPLALECEQLLIFNNTIPSSYVKHLPILMNNFMGMFENQPLSEVYFHDTNWLKLSVKSNDDVPQVFLSKDFITPMIVDLEKELIDDVTKTKVTQKEKLKKCLRCDRIRGDTEADGFYLMGRGITGAVTHWPVAYHRTCICGSCWVYIRADECGA